MRRLNRLPLRARLTLATVGAALLVLPGLGLFIFLDQKRALDDGLDRSLQARAAEVMALQRSGNGKRLRKVLSAGAIDAQLLTPSGRVVAGTPDPDAPPLISRDQAAQAVRGPLRFERDEAERVLARPALHGFVVAVVASMAQRERSLETLSQTLLLGGLLVLGLVGLAAYLVAGGALGAVDRMRRHAETIQRASPDTRLPLPPADDHLRRLGETINELLARLADAAEVERRFLANASHELRTPLTILRTELDLAEHPGADRAALVASIRSAREEVDRLIRLAADLLLLAGADESALTVQTESVALRSLVETAVGRLPEARTAHVLIEVPGELAVSADPDQLVRAIGNLIENALRHGEAPIRISAEPEGQLARVTVVDAGAGPPRGFESQAFERFTRAAAAGVPGTGLGLAIVRAIATAHGGAAGLSATPDGARAWITIPRSSTPADRRSAPDEATLPDPAARR